MAAGYIHTLGDSTLDNLFWMLKDSDSNAAYENSVEGQLQNLVGNDEYAVESHAYDGFTTKSVLVGDTIGQVLPRGPEYDRYIQLKAANRKTVSPGVELKQAIDRDPDNRHFVVISVGGNDFRENLLNPIGLLLDVPKIQERYLQIVSEVMHLKDVKDKNVEPILMFQYRTDANNDPYGVYRILGVIGVVAAVVHALCIALLTAPVWLLAGKISGLAAGLSFFGGAIGLYYSNTLVPLSVTKDIITGKKVGMSMLGALMRSFYQPILEKAKKEGIPILDLPNTFNPYQKLYECGIEPNKEGGGLIAEGIHHIVKHHDFKGESMIYSKPFGHSKYQGAVFADPSEWSVASPS